MEYVGVEEGTLTENAGARNGGACRERWQVQVGMRKMQRRKPQHWLRKMQRREPQFWLGVREIKRRLGMREIKRRETEHWFWQRRKICMGK